jgi:hypothetical protein
MTATTATKTTKTTVTVINRGTGSIELHRPGCNDLQRDATGATIWNVRTRGMRDVVLSVYPPEDHNYDANDWTDHADDITVMPCCPSLDGRQTKRNAEWARQYRLRTSNRYPVLITME